MPMAILAASSARWWIDSWHLHFADSDIVSMEVVSLVVAGAIVWWIMKTFGLTSSDQEVDVEKSSATTSYRPNHTNMQTLWRHARVAWMPLLRKTSYRKPALGMPSRLGWYSRRGSVREVLTEPEPSRSFGSREWCFSLSIRAREHWAEPWRRYSI